MKKINLLTIILFMMCILVTGCGKETAVQPSSQENTIADATAAPEQSVQVEVVTPKATPEATPDAEPAESVEPSDESAPEEAVTEERETIEGDTEAAATSGIEGTVTESTASDNNATAGRTIVWLGDSLTQGSLGDDNDNLAHAPYVKLQSLVKNKVEGYGMYGYKTHDIFWVYRDEGHLNQRVDPNKIYIFWVGSCDWCPDDGENTNTAPVIAEIDNFLAAGPVKDYIVIGTTQRWRLGVERARIINANLQAKYGSHYMDVVDIIAANGFSPDNTHLSQASYDAIASAVYNKLKALGYI